MKRVAVTKREAGKLAKEIGASWIQAAINLGWLPKVIEKRFPEASLAEQMKILERTEEALDELAERLAGLKPAVDDE
jgi:hypothetical protein